MICIGLGGGIASGKSIASHWVKEMGIPLVDADILAREILLPPSPILEEISKIFGSDFLEPDGSLNREKLGSHIFASPKARQQLDGLTHPAIHMLFLEAQKLYKSEGHKAMVYSAPLLFEAGAYLVCDKTILITTSKEAQIQRLASRNGFSKLESEKRIASQMSQENKINLADFLVANDSDLPNFKEAFEKTLKEALGAKM